ncbi:hypothetical protein N7447_004538 [Penicillium robsamsonii]|uniref:uncharacterized protein n=1 Tax=Penicillium robsamsonii TaxID=1792511 RepID=UPI0025473F72|nr:uncharacterized protein N7447_004538 [Penicillium robsamsonii]KAJ5827775.1 hypothetical protein N7447_004538 [Penicillium robsamsonii]
MLRRVKRLRKFLSTFYIDYNYEEIALIRMNSARSITFFILLLRLSTALYNLRRLKKPKAKPIL